MTAFDGRGSEVWVFFDSDGPEIELAFSDEPTYQPQEDEHDFCLTVHRDEVPQIIEDLVDAYWIRGGDPVDMLNKALYRLQCGDPFRTPNTTKESGR